MKRFLFILLALSYFTLAMALPVDETNLGALRKENYANMEFINTVISNLTPPNAIKIEGAEDTKKKKIDSIYYYELLNANKKDLDAARLYYKGEYEAAFRPMREAQGKLVNIYQIALEKHLTDTNYINEYGGTKIIRTKDKTANRLLKIAIKYQVIAERNYILGLNNSPHQYRNKIELFKEGIQNSRLSRRFFLAAMVELRTMDVDKNQYKKVSFDEVRKKLEESSASYYDRMKDTLRACIENRLIEASIQSPSSPSSEKINLLELHDDNWGIITYSRVSLLEETNKVLRMEPDMIDLKDTKAPTTKTEAPKENKVETDTKKE